MKKLKKSAGKIYALSNLIILVTLGILFSFAFIGGAFPISTAFTPYYRGSGDKPNVSLMINVYWGAEFIEDMLDEFDNYGVKATFFIGGVWASRNVETVRKIHERGHELANHGFLHKDAKKLSIAENRQEIKMTEKLIEEITGFRTVLFAPPSGSVGENMYKAAEELGYKVILWSKDTIDWRDKDSDLVFTRATRNLRNGDLILMHPSQHTLTALPKILKFYAENGFNQVTVSENITGGQI